MTSDPVRGHVVCAGLPGPQTELLGVLLEAVLRRSGRADIAAFEVDDAHDHLVGSLRHGAATAILVTHRPTVELVDAFARAGVPIVLAVPDLRSWVSRALAPAEEGGHGTDPYATSLAMFDRAAPLLDLAAACDPFLVTADDLSSGFAETIKRLVRHLRLQDARAGEGFPEELGPRIRALVEALGTERAPRPTFAPLDVLAGEYEDCFVERRTMSLSFGTVLLPKGASVKETRSGVLDLTGQAGPITFGPYVRLPRGPWRVRYVFAVASNLVDVPLRFSVTAMSQAGLAELARTDYTPRAFGEHTVELPFEVFDPLAMVEMSVHKTRAMFEGDFAIGSLTFIGAPVEAPTRGAVYDHLLDGQEGVDQDDVPGRIADGQRAAT